MTGFSFAPPIVIGPKARTNTNGIFSNLPAGTYTVSVTDSNSQSYTQTIIVLSAPNDLVISSPVTICSGQSTQLTVSGGINTYTWTASPDDSSIVNPNSATQTVSPTVTKLILLLLQFVQALP